MLWTIFATHLARWLLAIVSPVSSGRTLLFY